MADAKQKWKDATVAILDKLDIAAEYEALGVRLAAKRPSAKGWLECHAVDREDRSASAGIMVGEGPLRGRYKDFAGDTPGKTWGLFDFAAEKARKFGGDWKEARRHYARQTGIALPDGDEELSSDRFEFSGQPTAGVLLHYTKCKPGIRWEAIVECGGLMARWPRGLMAEKQNHLLAFPMYGAALLDLEPTAWHCVSQSPQVRIRKFRGKGVEEELLKTLTVGKPGLMNTWALARLAKAKVVWIVEGATDMLAGHSLMLDEPLERRENEVFLSAGACSYHPEAEWLDLFAGKECRVVFDVGDKDNAGQNGAAVWVGQLLKTASVVRNVQLPPRDDGKNDLRQWIVDGGDYARLCELAETFSPVEAGDVTATLAPHEGILRRLGLTVLGEHEGTQKIEIFSERLRKNTTIENIDRLTVPRLIQHVGYAVVDEHVHEGKEAQPGKLMVGDVRRAIAAAASDRIFNPANKYGAGVWEIDGRVIVVKARDAYAVEGRQLKRLECSAIGSHFLDLSLSTGEWFDPGKLQRHLNDAGRPEWCRRVFEEAHEIFAKWFWRAKLAPLVMASTAFCVWIQTLWEWRPQVAITGASNAGKTWLMKRVLASLYGDMARYKGKPTEAYIRQRMTQHHARAVLMDEFENTHKRQAVYEMFRVSGEGGEIGKGTQDGRGADYRIKHLPITAAIELGHKRAPDRNRYIVFDLEDIPEDRIGTVELPETDQLLDLGMRMLAVALATQEAARLMTRRLGVLRHRGTHSRVIMSLAVPCGMHSAIMGHDEAQAAQSMRDVIDCWDFDGQKSSDTLELLQEIFMSTIDVSPREKMTIHQAISSLTPGVRDALTLVGIAKVTKRGGISQGAEILFLHPQTVANNVLRPSGNFYSQAIDQYLLRIPGAVRAVQRLGGASPIRGIEIPMQAIQRMFHEAAEGLDEEQDAHDTF